MKQFIPIFFIILLVSCHQKRSVVNIDDNIARTVLTVFLSHAIHQNFDSLERITTKDYTVILDGEETQAELFVKFLKDFPNPYGYTYKIRDMRVKSDCNSAFLHFNFIEYLPDSGLVIKQ